MPSQRWFWGGFAAGLWAFVDRQNGRGQFLYSMRMSVESTWKVGRKRGWWKGWDGGDVAVFVVGLALTNAIFEVRRDAIEPGTGKGLAWLRGEDDTFTKKKQDASTSTTDEEKEEKKGS